MVAFRAHLTLLKIKDKQYKSYYFTSNKFEFLYYVIESLHISMSLDTNNRDVYLLGFTTEPFLLCISVIQWKLEEIIDSNLNLD